MSWPALATLASCSSTGSDGCWCFMWRRESVARGLVSVMPQPCTTSTPSASWYQRMSDGGGAEPPQVTLDSAERS